MKKILFPAIVLIAIACGGKFEPELTGWRAYTIPGGRLHLDLNGKEKTIALAGDKETGYRYAQWTKFQDNLLLLQIIKTERCYDYQIIAIDTAGTFVDTIYTAPPNTPLNFKLAPNDSLLILKTYDDNCGDDSDNYKYTFYNRYLKQALTDTIKVVNARGILLNETIWSPDSKKVIISQRSGGRTKAFAYDLESKDTTYIDKGSNFSWSPIDKNLVAYVKDYSIYTKNIETAEEELIYKGKRKKGAYDFRWNPTGDFMMVHFQQYLLNIDAPPLRSTKIFYLSMKDKRESKVFYDAQRIDTWKEGSATRKVSPVPAADPLK
jgi:hypothetical protein